MKRKGLNLQLLWITMIVIVTLVMSLRFEWTHGNYIPPAQSDSRPKYSRHSGPVHVLDVPITPLGCFNLFYTVQIFQDLVDFANENARWRKESDPDNNKGDWKMLEVDELKAYCSLVIMKDTIIKLDRDAHYWHQGGKRFLLYTRSGNVMSRDKIISNPLIPLLCQPKGYHQCCWQTAENVISSEQCVSELSGWVSATWTCHSGWDNGGIQGLSWVQTVYKGQTCEIWDQPVGFHWCCDSLLLQLGGLHR